MKSHGAVAALLFVLTAATSYAAGPAVDYGTGFPGSVTTGTTFSFSVAAIDNTHSIVTSYTGTVHFSGNDPAAVLPADYTYTPADAGNHTFSATLHGDNVDRSITITDVATPSITHTSTAFVENPAIVNSLDLVIQQRQNRGSPASFTVTARNIRRETMTNYSGTVHFTSTDPAAVLPPDYTFTPADQGTHTFSATFNTAGDRELTVSDATAGLTTTKSVRVVCSFNVSASNNGPTCPGGEVTLTATTDQPNDAGFDYAWRRVGPSFITHGKSITVNGAGLWQVDVTDPASGCTGTAQTTVQEFPGITMIAPASFCDGEVTQYDVTVTSVDGTPLSNLNWNVTNSTIVSGQGTPTVTIAAPANVSADVTVNALVSGTTSYGCSFEGGAETRFNLVPPDATINAPATVQQGGTWQASISFPSSTRAPKDVEWNVTNANVTAGTVENGAIVGITFNVAGTDPVTISVLYGATPGTRPRCRKTVSVTIPNSSGNTSTAPSAVISAPSSVCPQAQNLAASVPDAGAGATYAWTITNGAITSGQGTRAITFSSGGSGNVTLAAAVGRNSQISNGQAIVPIANPQAVVSGGGNICPGQSATITANFTGTQPFSATWSDGLVQSNVTQSSVQRTVAPSSPTTYTITSFSDAQCSGTVSGSGLVTPTTGSAPSIVEQPHSLTITPGTSATLRVSATGDNLRYQWYQVLASGVQPLPALGPELTTGPLTQTTTYRVRVSSDCGAVDSDVVTVAVNGSGRSGRRRVAQH
jgi:hypothetical protein